MGLVQSPPSPKISKSILLSVTRYPLIKSLTPVKVYNVSTSTHHVRCIPSPTPTYWTWVGEPDLTPSFTTNSGRPNQWTMVLHRSPLLSLTVDLLPYESWHGDLGSGKTTENESVQRVRVSPTSFVVDTPSGHEVVPGVVVKWTGVPGLRLVLDTTVSDRTSHRLEDLPLSSIHRSPWLNTQSLPLRNPRDPPF